jgi:hypothetical protein
MSNDLKEEFKRTWIYVLSEEGWEESGPRTQEHGRAIKHNVNW